MKFICEHNIPVENNENRVYTLAAIDKVDYIISVMCRCGINVEIVSASMTKNKKGWYSSRVDKDGNGVTIFSGSTFGANNVLLKILQKLYALIWLTGFLLTNCKKNEWVGTYHSVFTIIPLMITRKIRGIKILNEVEELFFDLEKVQSRWRIFLEKWIIKQSDAFIFVSQQVREKCIGEKKKPYVIANGNYTAADIITDKRKDKCVLVYAGLIKYNKVAFRSAEIAKYLTADYEVRIIGYGKPEDINKLCELIFDINLKSDCKVYFDGIKRGVEYSAYLQRCHIGLCPLTDDTTFQLACFPSKITSYIANGLHVVTTNNEVLKSSSYGKIITFVENNSPIMFAKAIREIRDVSDERTYVKKLDKEFGDSLDKMLKQIGLC